MRVKICNNCGGDKYKIIPNIGYFYIKCLQCDEIIEKIYMNKYNFLKPTCYYCNSDVFKANIYEEVEEIKWNLICDNCGKEAVVYSLSKDIREKVEADNSKEEPVLQVSLNGGLDVLRNRVNIMEQEIKKINSQLRDIEKKISNCKGC